MTQASYNSFERYLSSKRSVDDRALNPHVWSSFARAVAERGAAQPGRELRVLEVGAGIGTMIERCLERRLFGLAHYTAIDAVHGNMAAAPERLAAWGTRHSLSVQIDPAPGGLPTVTVTSSDGASSALRRLSVHLEAVDLFDFLARPHVTPYDVLIAHAFIDLVDVPSTLARLRRVLQPGSLVYLTINFDGATLFQPEIDPALDAQIERLYHRTMDERRVDGRPSGDSHTGRHLFGNLRAAGYEILDAGSSDWVVFAGAGGYPADEAYFLHFIVETLRGALAGHPELDTAAYDAWISTRHAQIERGELVYIAHQLDFLAMA